MISKLKQWLNRDKKEGWVDMTGAFSSKRNEKGLVHFEGSE